MLKEALVNLTLVCDLHGPMEIAWTTLPMYQIGCCAECLRRHRQYSPAGVTSYVVPARIVYIK